MVSTLKVQTIQIPNSDSDIITFDTSGNVTLNANKTSSGFGVSTASSTLPSEGGAATTNVVQGLIKGWIRFDGTGTIAIDDSFNYASITDNGTGEKDEWKYKSCVTYKMHDDDKALSLKNACRNAEEQYGWMYKFWPWLKINTQ